MSFVKDGEARPIVIQAGYKVTAEHIVSNIRRQLGPKDGTLSKTELQDLVDG